VLFYCGERRETPDPAISILIIPPTTETTPQLFLFISIGIVHKLWAFVWSKEPMIHGGVEIFVKELEGAVVKR
jgi:hypothetical protein